MSVRITLTVMVVSIIVICDRLTIGGGVRWYEFRIGKSRSITLYQQGTYSS